MDFRVTGCGLDSSCSGWDLGEKNEETERAKEDEKSEEEGERRI